MNTSNPADTFTAMLHAFDAKDWHGVRRAFTDEVHVDYHSLFGVAAARTRADDLVAGWERFAGGLDATQHITGPSVSSPSGKGLLARTHVRAYHRMQDAPGGQVWMVAGHYEVQLESIDDAWKIAGITLKVFYQEGNQAIPRLAGARAASAQQVS